MGGCTPCLRQMKGQGSRRLDKGQGTGCACAPRCGASRLGMAHREMWTPQPSPPGWGQPNPTACRDHGDLPRFHTCSSIPLRAPRFRAGHPEKPELPRDLSKFCPSERQEGPALPARPWAGVSQPCVPVGWHWGWLCGWPEDLPQPQDLPICLAPPHPAAKRAERRDNSIFLPLAKKPSTGARHTSFKLQGEGQRFLPGISTPFFRSAAVTGQRWKDRMETRTATANSFLSFSRESGKAVSLPLPTGWE